MRFRARLLVQLSVLVDAIAIAVVFALIWRSPRPDSMSNMLIEALIVPYWVSLMRYFGVYQSQRLGGSMALTRKIASTQFVGLLTFSLVLFATGTNAWRQMLLFVGATLVLLTFEKSAAHLLLRRIRRRGMDTRNALIIATRAAAEEIQARFREHSAWGLRVAMVGEGPPNERTFRMYQDSEPVGSQLEEILQTHVIDEVILAVKPEELAREQITIHICERHGIVARIMFDAMYGQPESARAEEFCGGLSFAVGPSRDADLVVKRAADFVLSALLLVLLLPVMIAVAVVVKLSSAGPVIFTQTRVGLRGRRFTLYKFRTMVCGAEALLPALASQSIMAGPVYKRFSDPRITAAGRILRKFSLDELPQLWNVLRGEMSLVGPRPLPVTESDAIPGEYRRRFSMRPGLTCFWQVNGRSNTEFAKWMTYDLQYVDRWSLLLDAKLLLQTIPVVISGKGAY